MTKLEQLTVGQVLQINSIQGEASLINIMGEQRDRVKRSFEHYGYVAKQSFVGLFIPTYYGRHVLVQHSYGHLCLSDMRGYENGH